MRQNNHSHTLPVTSHQSLNHEVHKPKAGRLGVDKLRYQTTRNEMDHLLRGNVIATDL